MKRAKLVAAIAVAVAIMSVCVPAAASAAESEPVALSAPSYVKLVAGVKCIKATWRSCENATGYIVRYSANKSMKGAKTVALDGVKSVKAKLAKLTALKTYYVQVRAVTTVTESSEPDASGVEAAGTEAAAGAAEPDAETKVVKSAWSKKMHVRVKIKTRSYQQVLNALSRVSTKSGVRIFGTDYKIRKTKAGKKLARQLSKLARRYNIAVDCVDLKTGQGFSFNGRKKIYSASSLKGPYTLSVNKYYERAAKRSRSTQRATCTWSSNDGYAALRNSYGSACMAKWMRKAGVSSWSSSSRYTIVPANDLAKLWVKGYWYLCKNTNSNSKWCKSILNHGTNAFIYQANKGTHTVYTKAGWYPGSARGSHTARNDAGIVMAGNHPYVLTIMSTAYSQSSELRTLAKLCDAVHADMVKGL